MKSQHKICIFPSELQLAEGAASLIVSIAKNAIEARGQFVLSLSGGHTPEKLYKCLTKPHLRDQIDWQKTFVFWGDERCVPLDDNENNAQMAKLQLLNHVAIPADNVYRIPVNLVPKDAAIIYENTINLFFKNTSPHFDLVLLGLGANGHTASLFPGNNNIDIESQMVREVYVAAVNAYRITMTASLFNQSRNILFLVAGKEKADILKIVLIAPYQPEKYPAQLIKPVNGNLYWYADADAAVGLPS